METVRKSGMKTIDTLNHVLRIEGRGTKGNWQGTR